MLTPEFRLEQTAAFVVAHIKAPYVKVAMVVGDAAMLCHDGDGLTAL